MQLQRPVLSNTSAKFDHFKMIKREVWDIKMMRTMQLQRLILNTYKVVMIDSKTKTKWSQSASRTGYLEHDPGARTTQKCYIKLLFIPKYSLSGMVYGPRRRPIWFEIRMEQLLPWMVIALSILKKRGSKKIKTIVLEWNWLI